MKNISKEFVNALCENLYMGYGNNDASIPTLGKSTVKGLTGVDNTFTQPGGTGEGSDEQSPGKGGGDGGVTDDQTAGYDSASKASPEGSGQDQSKSDPGTSSPGPVVTGNQENASAASKAKFGGTGLPETIGNRWSMPKPLIDHQEEIESDSHPASEEPEAAGLQERVAKLEEAVASFLEVIQNHIEEGSTFRAVPQVDPKDPRADANREGPNFIRNTAGEKVGELDNTPRKTKKRHGSPVARQAGIDNEESAKALVNKLKKEKKGKK